MLARRFGIEVGIGLLALCLATGVAGAGPQHDATPTLSNDSLAGEPEPLPAGWPSNAKDVQLRGAVCDAGYGKDGGRKFATPGDEVLPILASADANFDASYVGVRRVPFLTRRDVVQATFVPTADDASVYEVHLMLDADGAAKAQAFLESNVGQCLVIVASGKVLWHGGTPLAVQDGVLVLSGGFSSTVALAIVDLFGNR